MSSYEWTNNNELHSVHMALGVWRNTMFPTDGTHMIIAVVMKELHIIIN